MSISVLFTAFAAYLPLLTRQSVAEAVKTAVDTGNANLASYHEAVKFGYTNFVTAINIAAQGGDQSAIEQAMADFEQLIGIADVVVADNADNAPAVVAAVLADPSAPAEQVAQ